jgi:predicted anti-sigma-YlaC factor YlaD
MLNCRDVAQRLARLADEVAESEREALAEHLGTCAACRETADAQAEVAAILRSRPVSLPPAGLAARVSARIEAGRGWLGLADWRLWTLRLAPVAAALMAVALWLGADTRTDAVTSLAPLVESWASGEETPGASATSILWRADLSPDAMLSTVLTSGPDDPLDTGSGGPQGGVR